MVWSSVCNGIPVPKFMEREMEWIGITVVGPHIQKKPVTGDVKELLLWLPHTVQKSMYINCE